MAIDQWGDGGQLFQILLIRSLAVNMLFHYPIESKKSIITSINTGFL